jgi:hypothetical protein
MHMTDTVADVHALFTKLGTELERAEADWATDDFGCTEDQQAAYLAEVTARLRWYRSTSPTDVAEQAWPEETYGEAAIVARKLIEAIEAAE